MDDYTGDQRDVNELRHLLDEWSEDLELLRQNRLLEESALIRFANECGVPASGVLTGDPGDFNKRCWLPHDGVQDDGRLLFHPFRIYPLHRILEACKLSISRSSSLDRKRLPAFVARVADQFMPSVEQIGVGAREWNRVADLAILLDPIYWPSVTGKQTHSAFISDADFERRLTQYRQKALDFVRKLDHEEWQKLHEELRFHAATIDDNGALYLLLRLSKWERREKLKGRMAAALWIRHIAEILRRGFEQTTGERWPEEDQAFGIWYAKGRTVAYGSERPLDDTLGSGPHLSFHFGLFTGSAVRWYLEGDTEYHAVLTVLPEPAKAGIELVNLRGNLKSQRANIALKLSDGLAEDRAVRRFSMISFDTDVDVNVKTIRKHAKHRDIVGYIAAHRPDFEFQNFALPELVEIAASIDAAQGFSGDVVRQADWSGVKCSRSFEERYQKLSERHGASLKGETWGRALAEYAIQHPLRSDNDAERPYWHEISAALRGRVVNYDYQRDHFHFDPNTFEAIHDPT